MAVNYVGNVVPDSTSPRFESCATAISFFSLSIRCGQHCQRPMMHGDSSGIGFSGIGSPALRSASELRNVKTLDAKLQLQLGHLCECAYGQIVAEIPIAQELNDDRCIAARSV